MKPILRKALLGLGLAAACVMGAAADVVVTAGTGTTVFAFTCFTTKVCPAAVTVNSSGTEIATSSNPLRVDPTGTTTQPVNVASGGIASGAVASGAFASGSLATGSMVDFLTTRGTKAPGTAAANALLTGCVYTAAGVTLTDGLQAACQFTSTGGLLVSVANTNANGQATMANSSPVVIASNQTANALWGHGATGAAPPANAVQIGANASGATGGLMAGLIQCDSTAVYDASTSGSTELKALTSGRSIYVCGYSILSAGTVNVKLIYGTGTACATGTASMTPAYQLTTQVGLVDGAAFYRGMKTASANALCINTSGGVAVQAIVYYSVI